MDALLTALQARDVTPQVLAQVAAAKKIQAQTGLSPVEIALFWGNIETNGAQLSFYARLFLNKSARRANQAFEPNSKGEYLSDESQKIARNSLALLAAFQISSAELDLITKDLEIDPAKEQLSLAAVSQIYRYVVLAKALKIKIADLILIKQIFAPNPFSRWDGGQFVDLDTQKTLAFIELAIKIKDSGFKPSLLKYLFSGEAIEKNIALNEEKVLQIVRQARADLLIIETEYPEAVNTVVSEEFLRPKMQLIFDPVVVDEFFGIINENLRYGTGTLPNLEIVVPENLKAKTSYRKATGRLEFQGVMTDAEKTILRGLDPSENYQSAIDQIYEQPSKFFVQSFSHLFREEGALDEACRRLITRTAPGLTRAEKLSFFYQSYLPFLKEQLQNNAVLLSLSTLINLTLPQTAALVGSEISDLVKFFIPQGLTGKYFNTTDFTGDAGERIDPVINFTWSAPPIRTITGPGYSVRWEGYVCPDQTAEHTFIVEVPEADDSFKLQLGDKTIEKSAGNPALSWELAKSLKAGNMYFIKLEYVQRTGIGGVQVFWRTDKLPNTPITSLNLYPAQEIKAIQNKAGKYHRAANLINKYELTDLEIAYLTVHATEFADLDLTALTPQMWLRLNDYVALRKQTGTSGEAWILFFNAAQTATWETLKNWLSENIGWSLSDLEYLKTHFGLTETDFRNEEELVKIFKVFELTRKTGLTAQNLGDWARAVADFDQLEETAQAVKQVVRAKYEADEALEVATQLSDKIKERQKQALISALLVDSDYHDLRSRNVKDADGLFEYFLIDVQMTHCMDTSRLKQAISSVQSLVTRCLLNLESGVSPSNIDATKWAWMKNYRVWEAARKIFLFPENWLEPEWRDDRSPFFKELESELQQNDITAFTVETAFRNYLYKLNEVSCLNVCGVHEDSNTQTLHVFARTLHAPYQYFYRTRDKFKHWGAWEKVQLDIRGYEDLDRSGEDSGVHLIPTVWKSRLFLFWTELTRKTRDNPLRQNATYRDMAGQPPQEPTRYWEVRLAWSEYRDKKWTPKQLSNRFTETDQLSNPSSHLTRIEINSVTQELTLHASGGAFILSDVQSEINVRARSHAESSYNFYMGIRYRSRPLNFQGDTYLSTARDYKLMFSNTVPRTEFNLRQTYPFFYSDRERVYFVEPVNPARLANNLKNKNQIGFAPYSNYQSRVSAKNSAGLVKNGSLQTTEIAVGRSLLYETSLKTPLQETSLLLSGGTDMLPTLSKISVTNMSSVQSIGHAFSGGANTNINLGVILRQLPSVNRGLVFNNFYHPYGSEYVTQLNQKGASGLLQMDTDSSYNKGKTLFIDTYRPNISTRLVRDPLPAFEIDFNEYDAYSQYNYELFFHAPLYIAMRLSRNGKFAEAMQWFHSIFDPTTSEPADLSNPNARYWKFQPFRDEPKINLEEYLRKLQTGTDVEKSDITKKIDEWRENPLKPHIIARGRPIAYMKNVVMKYIENLLAWGDDLFRRDTIENINEATQIYIIAAHVLGKHPEFIPKRGETKAETYAAIESKLDAFSNAMVQMENLFPFSSDFNVTAAGGNPVSLLGIGRTLYFCIPNNEMLLGYWEKVADRLFKIRHCRNIEGVERHLALFEPPIDPALQAQAAAAGLNIGSILSDLNAPAPTYRFNFLLQKALEIVAEIKSLGNALLSAIEKGDNEAMTRLRAGHERQLLELITSLKEKQLVESRVNRESLEINRETSKRRLNHYKGLLGDSTSAVPSIPEIPDVNAEAQLPADTVIPEVPLKVDVTLNESSESGVKLIPKEKLDLVLSDIAKVFQASASAGEALAGIFNLFPVVKGHIQPFGVGASTSFGGPQLGAATSALAKVAQTIGLIYSLEAAQASKMASYIRRQQEWVMQANLAAREIIGLDKQIIAAKIREQIAQKDLDNHRRQIRNAEEVERFLQSKFTGEELYQWMKEQLVLIYKQSYQLATDMAKQAEKAYRFELGKSVSNFIQNNYWNNTFEGLTAGEKLHLSLKQMEKSYLEENRRDYELTKHVSLAMLHPEALLRLKQNGKCEFTLPEELFDLDYPGHYFRRIKSVSISIPSVAGPHTTVSATLRLLRNSLRINTALNESNEYRRNHADDEALLDDSRFVEYSIPFKAIATSSAQNDSGVFELNFRDERYLPYEGAGVISTWQLEMPDQVRQFDYKTISDVIVHLRYTARDGGGTLRNNAQTGLKARSLKNGFAKIFSLKHDFPQAFHRLTHPPTGMINQPVQFSIEDQHLPFFLAQENLPIKELKVYLQAKEPHARVNLGGFTISINTNTLPLNGWSNFGNNMIEKSLETNEAGGLGNLKRSHEIRLSGALPSSVDDVMLLFVI